MSRTQTISAPPVPPLKAQTSPLVNLFNQDNKGYTAATTHSISKGVMAVLPSSLFTIWIYFSYLD